MFARKKQTAPAPESKAGGPRQGATPAARRPDTTVYWQRSLGNRLFQEIAPTGTPRLQRACACGGSCPRCSGGHDEALPVQTKLTVGAPNDRFEQQADRVADLVMRMPEPQLQRQEEEEEMLQAKPLVQRQEEEEEMLQTKPH